MPKDSTPKTSSLASAVFRDYGAQLHRFLLRRLSRPSDADDLAQEVFIRLARLDKPELVRKPQAYLFSVAANLVREFQLRHRAEEKHVVYDSETAEHLGDTSWGSDADEMAEHLNIQMQLERALARLPRLQRAVFLLVKLDGLSHKEVARRTGLNPRTVERYVMEATAQMLTQHWDR